MEYTSYITDLHLNLHPSQLDQLDAWIDHCERVCDFFTLAYYPYELVELDGGFKTEREIDHAFMQKQWAEIANCLAAREATDGFICFSGFEWQGMGLDGDHNVYFKSSGDISLPPRYKDLVEFYQNQDVIAIPHHLAYALGHRGKNWSTHNEKFSPIAEIFSHHGSSESDCTSIAMDRHVHMGPRVEETSVVAGLGRGMHVGLICSGDNHEVPAMTQYGRAGVWAKDLSRDAIWEALCARRTFGFTGPRIEVWTEIEGQPMGSIVETESKQATLHVQTRANSKIERIELYKNGRLHEVHVVPWDRIEIGPNDLIRLKVFIEFGWGPNPALFPSETQHVWNGVFSSTGRIVGVESVYASMTHRCRLTSEGTVEIKAVSSKGVGSHWARDGGMRTEGCILELEGRLTDKLSLVVNGDPVMWSFKQLLSGSFVEVLEADAKRRVAEKSGMTEFYRSDAWYHNAYKIKVHQAFPQWDYEVDDMFDLPVAKQETGWFVKIVQADGQTAWSSPTWLQHR